MSDDAFKSANTPLATPLPAAAADHPGGVDYDDSWERRWNDMRKYGPTGRHLRRIVTEMVRPLNYDSLLDVGCGQGSLLATLMPLKPQASYTGLDFAAKAIDVARRRAPNAEFGLLDVAAGHLDRRFDLVVCTDVVEHIEDDVAALRNLAAMTGRYLLVSTLQGRMRDFERTVGHHRNYARGELQAKIQSVGLEIERVVEWGFPFFSPLYRNVLGAASGQGTEGDYGPGRRLIAEALYHLFRLNSWSHGDYIYVLARRPGS
ncbi:methyltransferase [Azospirillum sp. TSH7]|uniref:class I SAM-dependent methyltransferase n=1 Tax=unclassified Azospirillum TaxID=2630922 RepID=UPI000D607CF1|nr:MULTISPECIES: class I SAM-dependent methyltransferase [unclassified Azospirillum]PWC56244.1 methyltransferase [Azospirillum sp. TSH7]PWC61245.1 methyltransferase [Azospirillum sp. TSH20]